MAEFIPKWKEHEKDMAKNGDAGLKAAEAFDETRKKEILTNTTAKNWEADRKKEWAKAKPKAVKDRIARENKPLEDFRRSLKNLGRFDSPVKAMPGFVLVLVDEKEEQTVNGIFIPTTEELPNTGSVVSVGSELHISKDKSNIPPVGEGARVIFKKGAGADLSVMGKFCLLMQFSDLLGEIEE